MGILITFLLTLGPVAFAAEDEIKEETLFPQATTTEAGSAGSGDYETTLRVRRPITAASSGVIRERDVKLRPIRRPADVLQVTPGLFVVQHAGGGKANQYFLRGYDADHGTDVALFIDGIPVNQVSHGHGQGYSDMNWLIVETVDRVEVFKGTYFPHLGDFATAGGINVITHKSLPNNQFTMSGGMLGTTRAVAIATEPVAGLRPLVAAEIYTTDGPFQNPEKLRRYNVMSKFTKDFSEKTSVTMGFNGNGGKWNASGQIPSREVDAGRLDRFGSLDPTEGGDSNRYSVYGNFQHQFDENSKVTVNPFFNYYRLDLYSNFTFQSVDPINGDQINQKDNRTTAGLDANYRIHTKLSDIPFETTVGLQGRNDNITNGLFNTVKRQRLATVRENDIKQRSVGLYAFEETTWTPWVRSAVGMRADHYFFDVKDNVANAPLGIRDDYVVSPKANLIFTPLPKTDLFLNYGQGFHSNDSRGVFAAVDPAKPLNKVFSYEAGARTKILDTIDIGAAGFLQYSDGEVVYVGDAGTTENKGPSRRLGFEFEARAKVTDWLYTDFDLNLVKPELTGIDPSANSIPYAPTRIITAGISVQHPKGYFGRLGFFHIGDRPASEDRFLTAQGFSRFDTTVGYRQKRFEVALAVQNLFNTKWREAQFATTSRTASDTPTGCPAGTRPGTDDNGNFAGCEDVNFTPGNPINIQGTATVFF